jgi:hypothetical protein
MMCSDEEFEIRESPETGEIYFEAILKLRMKLDGRRLNCQLSFNGRVIAAPPDIDV